MRSAFKPVYNMGMILAGKTVLVTGAAQRIGRGIALGLAQAGADLALHFHRSAEEIQTTAGEIHRLGRRVILSQADFSRPEQVTEMMASLFKQTQLFAVVNSAAIFQPLEWDTTGIDDWNLHLQINLTAPFLISQGFARQLPANERGRIVNILDWRALRPGKDHFPYTISKAALAALTRSLAQALAPRIAVNGVALGAILPPADMADSAVILQPVPARRWGSPEEVAKTVEFLLAGPADITGEIIHLDGGRHLV